MATPANPYGLTDEQNLAYDSQRRNIQSQEAAQLAANEYGRFASQQRFSRQNQASNTQWQNNRLNLQSPFLQHGIGHHSLLWQQALSHFNDRRTLAQNDQAANQYDTLHNYDLQGAQYQQSAADALTALEEQRQAQIRQYLSGLGGFQQQYGTLT